MKRIEQGRGKRHVFFSNKHEQRHIQETKDLGKVISGRQCVHLWWKSFSSQPLKSPSSLLRLNCFSLGEFVTKDETNEKTFKDFRNSFWTLNGRNNFILSLFETLNGRFTAWNVAIDTSDQKLQTLKWIVEDSIFWICKQINGLKVWSLPTFNFHGNQSKFWICQTLNISIEMTFKVLKSDFKFWHDTLTWTF